MTESCTSTPSGRRRQRPHHPWRAGSLLPARGPAARDARRCARRGGRGRPRRQRYAGRSDPHRHRHRPGGAGDVRAISRRGPRAGPVRCGCRDGHGDVEPMTAVPTSDHPPWRASEDGRRAALHRWPRTSSRPREPWCRRRLLMRRCTPNESISVPERSEFYGPRSTSFLPRRAESGIIQRTRNVSACYCRSQLQLWFPKTSSAPAALLAIGSTFVFPVISGRGNHRGDTASAQCGRRCTAPKEI